jgi:hypothetical protein
MSIWDSFKSIFNSKSAKSKAEELNKIKDKIGQESQTQIESNCPMDGTKK